MHTQTSVRPPIWRTLLILGRVSNLPTVWSNCLAGWLLGGGGTTDLLFLLLLAGTALYIGGMYLNDAFDAEFDRQHRAERPIPSGHITAGEVWGYGLGLLFLGMVLFLFCGKVPFLLSLFLLASILVYDAVHKAVAFSPVLMSFCRFFLFLTAAACGSEGVTGIALWAAIVLACYIIGLSYVARSESTRGSLKYWPCIFLAAPLVLGYLANSGEYRARSLFICAILALWIFRNLRFTFGSARKNIGRTVSGLLAGIVWVDLLAIGGGDHPLYFVLFALLFGVSLLFQRFIPAT
ncbi:MAG: UbiA family prenyltransferase [Verrucomicrobiales bacterium]